MFWLVVRFAQVGTCKSAAPSPGEPCSSHDKPNHIDIAKWTGEQEIPITFVVNNKRLHPVGTTHDSYRVAACLRLMVTLLGEVTVRRNLAGRRGEVPNPTRDFHLIPPVDVAPSFNWFGLNACARNSRFSCHYRGLPIKSGKLENDSGA